MKIAPEKTKGNPDTGGTYLWVVVDGEAYEFLAHQWKVVDVEGRNVLLHQSLPWAL